MKASNLIEVKPLSVTFDWAEIAWKKEEKKERSSLEQVLDYLEQEVRHRFSSPEKIQQILKIIDVCIQSTNNNKTRTFIVDEKSIRIKAEMQNGTWLGYSINLEADNSNYLYSMEKD